MQAEAIKGSMHGRVLPLLQEQDTRASTVEERVIGAGLKALEKHEDGAAIKGLFHMFAGGFGRRNDLV